MDFKFKDVTDDGAFTGGSDPMIRAAMKRKAGAAVMQDVGLNTYWANTSGKSPLKHPGASHMHRKELCENLKNLMGSRMSYPEMEEFLVMLGYEAGDIRESFECETGLDPVKLAYMRSEDVKNTPSNIPWYNYAWGHSKKGGCESYFINKCGNDLFTVFAQVDDMTREEESHHLTLDKAIDHMKGLVKKLHRYDMTIPEQIEDAESPIVAEPQKKEWQVLSSYINDGLSKGSIDKDTAFSLVQASVNTGTITLEEGETMLRVADVLESGSSTPNPMHTSDTPENADGLEISDAQSRRVIDEVDEDTPQEYFNREIGDADPSRGIDEIASDHVKSVLSYIANREADMGDFGVALHSFKYKQHESPNTLVQVDPQTGRPAGPPKATISAVLDVNDKTLPEDGSGKFALAVFFVNVDGEVTTSDSVKGEDDIIYGFSEDGMRQYFARDRLSEEAGPELE